MIAKTFRSLTVIAAASVVACVGGSPRAADSGRTAAPADSAGLPNSTGASTTPGSATVQSPSREAGTGRTSDTNPVVPSRPAVPKSGAQDTNSAKPIPPGARTKPINSTVHDVLATSALAGQLVHVSGRCLGDSPAIATGGPPVTRSDWQLASGGEAVFVTGPKPLPCQSAEADVSITARVAVDTVRKLGRTTPRRYLVRQVP